MEKIINGHQICNCWMSGPLSILKRLIVIKNNLYQVAFERLPFISGASSIRTARGCSSIFAVKWGKVKAYKENRTENVFLMGMFLDG